MDGTTCEPIDDDGNATICEDPADNYNPINFCNTNTDINAFEFSNVPFNAKDNIDLNKDDDGNCLIFDDTDGCFLCKDGFEVSEDGVCRDFSGSNCSDNFHSYYRSPKT
ncbi:MAG: hypothetical protein DHS20C13_28510 [Thermodesulfobacteriota bacterium]|nr:MAG: hypothetical protein DHS20C13_28510 [Thermodesulfobacteriota bacterium]